MLVHRAKRAQGHVIFNSYVAGQRGVIGKNAVAAHLAVVPYVHVTHQQVARANASYTSAAHSSAANGYAFANRILFADYRLSWLALIFQVLRRHADRRERINHVPRSHSGAPVEHNMRDEPALLAQHHVRADGAEGPHFARLRNYGARGNYRACVYAHSAPAPAPASSADAGESAGLSPCALCSRSRVTTAQVSVASHASLPSTRARPAMRPARDRIASTSTSMRNWSPGVTGLRNLAFSIPVKTASFVLRSSISANMISAPAWAMASITI